MSDLENILRKERTDEEFSRLSGKIKLWIDERQKKDKTGELIGRQATRLEMINKFLTGAKGILDDGIKRIKPTPGQPTDSVYQAFQPYDETIVWLDRACEYFSDKYAQRDVDQKAAAVLEAADEVVWSCYQPPISKVYQARPENLKPAPLPYLAAEYSPAARQSDKGAPEELLRGALAPGLRKILDQFPVGLLRLPPWCIEQPWWLIFIAHEVGHHVLHDLALAAAFSEQVTQIAQQMGITGETELANWERWSEEIFADFYAVVMTGEAAVWALWEIVRTTPPGLLRPGPLYPPSAIRILLMIFALREIKLSNPVEPTGDSLGDLESSLNTLVETSAQKTNLQAGKKTVEYLIALEVTNPKIRLIEACGISETQKQMVIMAKYWEANLVKATLPPVTVGLEQARWILIGSFRAWQKALKTAERKKTAGVLSRNTLAALRKAGPPGKRGIDDQFKPESALERGKQLAQLLLDGSELDTE